MMYLFFCENPQCTQIWKVIRSSIESNNKELEKNLSITANGSEQVKAKRIIERIKQLTVDLSLNSKNRRE